jgi:hypothetical protein
MGGVFFSKLSIGDSFVSTMSSQASERESESPILFIEINSISFSLFALALRDAWCM